MCDISIKLDKKDYPEYIYKVAYKIRGIHYGIYTNIPVVEGEVRNSLNVANIPNPSEPKFNSNMYKYSLRSGFRELKHAILLLHSGRCGSCYIPSNRVIIKIKVDKRKLCFKGTGNCIMGIDTFFGISASIVTTYGINKITKNQIVEEIINV